MALKLDFGGEVVEAPRFGLPPLTLWDKFLDGVGLSSGCFRSGDSGLGSEGRFGLN